MNKELVLLEFIKKNLNYEFLDGEFLTPQYGERDSLEDGILKWRLKKSIKRINDYLQSDEIDEIMKIFLDLINLNKSMVNINTTLNNLIKDKFLLQESTNNKYNPIKIIDWDNINQNEFLFVNNFKVKNNKNTFVLDFIIFINGIPFVVFQTKIINNNISLEEAYKQLNKYIKELPQIFNTNSFNGILSTRELYIGTIDSNVNQYVKWGNYSDFDDSLKIIFQQTVLMDFIKNFIIDLGKNNKYICRYYHFTSVTKIISRLVNNTNNRDRGGLIYYPPGAGKFITIGLLVRKIRQTIELKDSTIIILTSSIQDLTQLEYRLKEYLKDEVIESTTAHNLCELLLSLDTRIILTTVQKFSHSKLPEDISSQRDFIVLVNNAEVFQKGQMALNIRKMIPSSTFIGFTSIPNNEVKMIFGDYIDNISLQELINTTLTDIKYENRTSILNGKDRIDIISRDIVKHYRDTIYPKGFKALLTCSSNQECIEYYYTVSKYIEEYFNGEIEVKLLIANYNTREREAIMESLMLPIKQDKTAIVIVNEMLLTGFDSPIIKCLYVNKNLKNYKLMQAIARVNRQYSKYSESGYIIDYFGIESNLEKLINIKGNYITKVEIKNVRNLNNLKINLSKYDKKHLILTGRNGSGKTSLLIELRNFMKSIENNEIEYVYECEQKIKKLNEEIAELRNVKNNDIVSLNKAMDLELYEKVYMKYCKNINVDFNTVNFLSENYNNGKYILAFFDARRENFMYSKNNIEKVKLETKYKIDDYPGKSFIQYLVDLKTQQSFAINEKNEETWRQIEEWFNNLEIALKEIFEDETLKLVFNSQNYDFKINQSGKMSFGLEELSDGYSSVLYIITNLMMKMESMKKDYLGNIFKHFVYDIEGIVIIDEIETHLHIELQKKILPFLTKLFPKIQFIISTHSPFVLSSLENAVIYDLERHIQVEDLSKYSYKGVVEGYYYIDQYSYKIKNKIERYEELIIKLDKNEDEEIEMLTLRRYLKDIPRDLAPELVYKFNDLELKRMLENND